MQASIKTTPNLHKSTQKYKKMQMSGMGDLACIARKKLGSVTNPG
jgi:hypothetical protein